MMKIFLYFFALVISFSCTTYHSITIGPDRSATIQSEAYVFDSLRAVKSNLISDFKAEKWFYSFKISEIDSLGNYMGDVLSDKYISFHSYSDSLVIISNNNFPVKEKFDDWSCCGYYLFIKPDKEIKKYYTEGKRVRVDKKRKSNSVTIFWDIKHRRQIENRAKKVVIVY